MNLMVRSGDLRSSSFISDPIKDTYLPPPPVYAKGKLSVPTYLDHTDPRTRWMLNLLRTGTDYRLSLMIHQKPECFQFYYQIPDCPATVCNDKSDNNCMFHRNTILYFNALCLSIYMKKIKAVEAILKSGLISPGDYSYACDVYTRGSVNGSDILGILPTCICIRREVFSAIPLLAHIDSKKVKIARIIPFTPKDKIELHYINRDIQKKFTYTDCLHYATETLKKSGSFPLARMVDILLLESPEFFAADNFEIVKKKRVSLFQRFALIAYHDDKDCRMSLQIFQSLENIIKYKCVPWKAEGVDSLNHYLHLAQNNIPNFTDQYSCINILLALYERLLNRPKGGLLSYLGDLIYKTINYVNWTPNFMRIQNKELVELFQNTPQSITVSEDTIQLIKRHIITIIKLERDRDLRTLYGRSKKSPVWKTIEENGDNIIRKQPSDSDKIKDDRVKVMESHILSLLNPETSSERGALGDYVGSSSPSPTESLNKYMSRDCENYGEYLPTMNAEELQEIFRVDTSESRPFEQNHYNDYAVPNNPPPISRCKDNAHLNNLSHNNSCNYTNLFSTQNSFRTQHNTHPYRTICNTNSKAPSLQSSRQSFNSNKRQNEMSSSDLEIQEYENSVLNELYFEYGEETMDECLFK